jgi:Peptidase M66
MRPARACIVVGLFLAIGLAPAGRATAAPACPISYGTADNAKPNKLYLYFPTVADATFPQFGMTSPLAAFNVANLTSYTGTAAALRDAVTDVVADDYCEFDVQVRQTTTAPPTTFARRNTVGIGTDDNDGAFGLAQAVDAGDPTAVDFAREWAGSYQSQFGGAGGALNGANSTLKRWARGIGGTAAHEAGHNYGLAHGDDSTSVAGEDVNTRHLMAAGSTFTGEQRVGYRRHFSNRTFSILAANVGLSIQTMHNWDLVNPNAQTAFRLRMDFLSTMTSAILSWSWLGPSSPWSTPTVTKLSGTTTFKGTTYNRFRIEWSTPKAWSGGASGQVPGGGQFHVGATFSGVDFNQPDPIIITNTQLLDSGGTPLTLQPRLAGYDAGTLDAADGSFDVRFFNVRSAQPILIRNLVVRQLPRVLSLNAMNAGARGRLFDWTGHPFSAWPKTQRTLLKKSRLLKRGQGIAVTVARLSQPRHIFERWNERNCKTQDNINGTPDVARCVPGYSIDLFPATTFYLTGTVVVPNAKHWNRKRKRYVVSELTSQLFVQIGGRRPDLNKNRVDDAIDIATGHSKDENKDGVPDEAQRPGSVLQGALTWVRV